MRTKKNSATACRSIQTFTHLSFFFCIIGFLVSFDTISVGYEKTMKCSNQYVECRIAEWLWRIVPLTLLIFGTCGNIVNIIVLSRRNLRRYSTSVYLLVLAVSDTLALLVGSQKYTYSYLYESDFQSISYFHCKFARWIGMSSAVVSQWTMVILTIERLLLTMYPMKAKFRLTPKVSALVSLTTVLVILFLTGHLLFSHRYLESDLENETDFSRCVYTTPEFSTFDQTTYRYIILVFCNLMPIAIIITGNAVIGTALLKRRHKIHPTRTTNQLNLAREKMAVKMLFAISILNIIFTTPFCIYPVVRVYSSRKLTDKEEAVDQLANAICHMLLLCNFTFNFLLYFARGLLFRKECIDIYNAIKIRFLEFTSKTSSVNETDA